MSSSSLFSGYSLGVVFIISVAVIWAGASVLTQYIYNDLDFQSPFLVTYLSTTLFALYLPLWIVWVKVGYVVDPPFRRKRESMTTSSSSSSESFSSSDIVSETNGLLERTAGALCSLFPSSSSSPFSPYESLPLSDDDHPPRSKEHSSSPAVPSYSHEEVMVIALKVAPLWFIANCLYNFSLLLTSVGSSTIISNLSGSFTLLFAYLFHIEAITGGKLLALFVSLGGVALVAVQDEGDDGSSQTLAGDVVALAAAAFYGLYTTTIRIQVPEDDGEGVSMQLLFGYIGLVTALMLSPCLFFLGIFHLGNWSDLTGEVFGFLVLGSIFNNVISDYLWARSVILTSPTIATVGLSITIPLAMLSDFLFYGSVPTFFSGSGAALVIAGFVIISAEEYLQQQMTRYCGCCLPAEWSLAMEPSTVSREVDEEKDQCKHEFQGVS